MKALRIILSVAGVATIIMVGAGAYLFLYLDKHKDILGAGVSRALGREVRIESGVKMHWSLRPSVELIGLRVGNPAWAKGEYLARVGRTVLRFGVGQLLRGHFEVDEVILEEADIDLETGSDGRGNWSFDGQGGGLSMESLMAESSRIGYRSPDGRQYHLEVAELEMGRRGGAELALDGRVAVVGVPILVSGTASPGAETGDQGWRFQLRAEADSTTLVIAGLAAGTFALRDVTGELHSKRLDLDGLLSTLWPTLAATGSVKQVDAHLTTGGGTIQALIGNLSGELRIEAMQLTLPAQEEKERQLTFTRSQITAAPGQPVTLKTNVTYAGQEFELDLAGGALADLLSPNQLWQTIGVSAEGQFGGQPLVIRGKVGTLSALLSGKDLSVELKAFHHGMEARTNGKLAHLDGLAGARLAIHLAGPSASRLDPWLGMEMPDSEPFSINARLEGGKRSLNFKQIEAKIGASDISGQIDVRQTPLPQVNARLTSRLLDLTPYTVTAGSGFEASGQTLSRELPLESLHGQDVLVNWRADHLRVGEFGIDRLQVDGVLDTGHLRVDMTAGEELLTANIDLKPEDPDWRLNLRHRGKLNLGKLVKGGQDNDPLAHAPLAVDLELTGTGKSPAALLATTDGKVELVVGEGRLSRKVVDLPLGTLLYTLLGAIAPGGVNQTYVSLDCAVLQFDVAGGLATSNRGLALRTDAINALGTGTLNLQTGEIDLGFKTAKRKGLGISILGLVDKFLRLTGTLWQPKVEINPVRAMAHAGAAWASGGLSVLFNALASRLTAFDNPCEIVLSTGRP